MKFLRPLLRTLVFLLLCWESPVTAQTFQPATTPLLSQEVAPEQANECYLYLNNPSGDTLYLKWRQLETSLPEGWDIDLCDYGACYVGIPPNGIMSPVFDTIHPYLKLIVQPGTTPGAAWCWFRVQDATNAANFVDLYFSLFSPGTTAATTPDGTSMRVFPNPARDFLVIDYPGSRSAPARLSDAMGRIVWQENIVPNIQTRVSVATWPTGVYFLQMGRETRRVLIDRQ